VNWLYSAVRQAITTKTKAILVVNLFAHPARLAELRDIANEHGLSLIEDNAQSPLPREHGRACGTIGAGNHVLRDPTKRNSHGIAQVV